MTMLGNYLKIAFRNMKRHKGYAFINTFGLAVGLTCFFLLMIYVRYELSYEKFHVHSNRIFRVAFHLPGWNYKGSMDFCLTTAPLGPVLEDTYPEVVAATRLRKESGPLSYGDKKFQEQFIYGDTKLFEVFTYPLIKGDPETALAEPYSIVISRKMAEKFFGDADPLGNVVRLRDETDLRITGVSENAPPNSHIQFDGIISFATLEISRKREMQNWGSINYCTYVLLDDTARPEELEAKFPAIVEQHHKYDSEETKPYYFLQPLTSIHLRSHLNFEISENSDIKIVYLMISIACLILGIACINYINLATARASQRNKEIGIRKTVGAKRPQLILQFLGESMTYSFIAVFLSMGLVCLLLPVFGTFARIPVAFSSHFTLSGLFFLASIYLVVGVSSGMYPAFLLASFRPAEAMKNKTWQGRGRRPFNLRNVLVVFQFCISVALILAAWVIQKQLQFIKYTDLGYDRDHIVEIRAWEDEWREQQENIKSELMRNPKILGASAHSRGPLNLGNVGPAEVEGDNGEMGRVGQIYCCYIDYDFLDLYGIEVVEGRPFAPEFATDRENAVIINQTTADVLGLSQPIGKKFTRGDIEDGRIIGVVRDFHFSSFRMAIEPMFFLLRPERAYLFSIKIAPGEVGKTLAFIRDTFRRFNPSFLFDYRFLDESFNAMYQAELRLGTILVFFSFVAIILTLLGLIGLIFFILEKKTKEIGIRKVLGASVFSIVRMLNRELIVLVGISNAIALPVAYVMVRKWLEAFAYRIDLTLWPFVFSGSIVLLTVAITVSLQSMRSATANPVDSLRHE
jgi:putative ABC transport system permease protein